MDAVPLASDHIGCYSKCVLDIGSLDTIFEKISELTMVHMAYLLSPFSSCFCLPVVVVPIIFKPAVSIFTTMWVVVVIPIVAVETRPVNFGVIIITGVGHIDLPFLSSR